jgi:hypothetical protein
MQITSHDPENGCFVVAVTQCNEVMEGVTLKWEILKIFFWSEIVVYVCHGTDCHNVFALMCRSNQELKEKLYSFILADEESDKLAFLRTLCRQMANTVCKADAVSTAI